MSSKFVINEVLPRVPFLVRLAIAHSFGLLETSSKWNLKSTLIIRFVRSMLEAGPPKSISAQQAFFLRDPGIEGPMWVSKATVPAPDERDALDNLLRAVDSAKAPNATYDTPIIEPVQGEWTGFRKGVDAKAKHLAHLSELELYNRLVGDTTSDITVLYMHGGALYLMDPATHRPVCSMLGKLTSGKCFSIRYRLAPQYAFPAALLDCLLAYLYLLSPPPGSYHEPVPASRIVFSGDSAGAMLSFALLQLILTLRRSSTTGSVPTIRFHGKDVLLDPPAGVAVSSPWLDLTRSMPSIFANARYDYVPTPTEDSIVTRFPPCKLWPTQPTREDLYCDVSMLMHPLASPFAAPGPDWKGSCPVFVLCGEEMLADECKVFSKRLARQDVPVQWEEYEAMPHCWPMVLRGTDTSRKAFRAWADFILKVTKGEVIETRGTWTEVKTLTERSVDVRELTEITDAQAEEKMRADVRRKEAYGAGRKDGQMQARL